MTMTPIHRIPRDATVRSLTQVVYDECPTPPASIVEALVDALDPAVEDPDDKHNTIVLDWAAQLRDELGIDWASAIKTASVMYYG